MKLAKILKKGRFSPIVETREGVRYVVGFRRKNNKGEGRKARQVFHLVKPIPADPKPKPVSAGAVVEIPCRGIELEPGVFSGCDTRGGTVTDCPTCNGTGRERIPLQAAVAEPAPQAPVGTEEGDTCGRKNPDGTTCAGKLEFPPVENCSCHISPPCHKCTERRLVCAVCGWCEEDEPEAAHV